MAAGVSPMLISLVLLIFCFILPPCQGRLYSLGDDIILLDNNTIDAVVYNSPVSWIVEFYSSWCGHCQAFAPTWKKLATVVKDWQDVIQVAALDCADDRNIQTCRDYDIAEYPTIKFFNTSMTDKKNTGKNFKEYTKEDKTFINLLHTMVDVAEQQKHLPGGPLKFKPIDDKYVDDSIDSSKDKMLLILFEEPYSYVGKELILDMMRFPQLDVRRSTDHKSPLMTKYNIARKRLPVLIEVEKGHKPTEISRMKRTHADFKKAILQIVSERELEEKPFTHIKAVQNAIEHFENLHHEHMSKHTASTGDPSEVYMIDMISGLSHMIWNEVPNRKEIGRKAFTALKNFVGLVSYCIPGSKRSHVKKFFRELYLKLSSRLNVGRITSKSFIGMVNRINKPGSSILTKHRTWHACQGSKPRYRGYPCSLWTLFHTLTVNCPVKRKMMGEDDGHNGLDTLKIIRGYVKYFFGCTKCVEHFLNMSNNIDKEVESHDSAILWLWQGHNKANKRLHGDDSEDPEHQKVQFPSKEMCKECRDEHGNWKNETVLRFLKDHYGVDNIRVKLPVNVVAELNDADQVRHKASVFTTAFTLGLNKYDTSLCLVVYTAIGLALIALYVYFIRRRRRRPYKYHIHTP